MESGNSGSMQSSSGGDEEYESRGETLPAFLNTSMPFGAISTSQQVSSLLSSDQIHSSFLFNAPNSSGSFLHITPHPPESNPTASNPLLSFDLLRPGGGGSRPARSVSGFAVDFEDVPVAASSSGHNNNALASGRAGLVGSNLSSGQDGLQNPGSSLSSPVPSQQGSRDQHASIPVRNPKKRTRASRRAPTTVLTTDTTNFRAMVQEFTGIPAPPFAGSTSYSRKLDLFGGSSSGVRSGHLEPMGSLFPIRPSPQKIQPSPLVASSSSSSSPSLLNSSLSSTSIANSAINSFSCSSQNVNMLTTPNSLLTFQSLMQSQGNIAMPPPFEEVGIGHGGLNVSLDRLQGHHHAVSDPHLRERNDNGYDNHRLRPSLNEKYGNSSQRVSSCKLNYSNSSSDFQHEKGLDNVGSRGEGTVDSWICPSD